MAAVCIHAVHKRFSHSLKPGQAGNNFLSTLKQGLVTFQDGGWPISFILLLPIPPQIIFQNRCFDVCTSLVSTHRYTKDSYSIMGIARGGVKVCFDEGMLWGGVVPLVLELVRVSVEPPLWRHGSLVQMVALIAALAGLDKHHRPVKALTVRAGKGHAGCASTAR